MGNDKIIPLVRPAMVPWEQVEPKFAKIWHSGQLTIGPCTRVFEDEFRAAVKAKHAIALSSCTSGLMLLLKALDITGEVILPSFTWTSTGHALVWNQIKPVFADCNPGTYTLNPEDVKRKITGNTGAIFATNAFGLPPDYDQLAGIAEKAGIPFLCDSAQAIGATYNGRPAGAIAHAEVFSLSPTKVVTAMEGGLVTTDDDDLADRIRQMRDYGKSADGLDVEFFGLSARISEFHSLVGSENLKNHPALIESRKTLAGMYKELLSGTNQIDFQVIPDGYESSNNYFMIFVDDPDGLADHLDSKGIQSKRYFYPPLHKQASYLGLNLTQGKLPETEKVCSRSLALPFYSFMPAEDVQFVAAAIREYFSS